MRLQLLYFDGCPNWHVADDRLRQALGVLASGCRAFAPVSACQLAAGTSPSANEAERVHAPEASR